MDPETAGSGSAPGMPEDLSNMAVLKHVTGDSGGVFILQDRGTRKKYTLKTEASRQQLRHIILSDRLCQLAGVPVPSFSVFDSIPHEIAQRIGHQPTGLFQLSEFIEADEPLTIETVQENQEILDQFSDGFVVDALLGNHEIAAHLRNTMVEQGSHQLFRIDNACRPRDRARGKLKDVNSIVSEIDTLRCAPKDVNCKLLILQLTSFPMFAPKGLGRSERSNLGSILYQNVDEGLIRKQVKELIERFPAILEELYTLNRALNPEDGEGTEFIQWITNRLLYLRHRFCPEFPLEVSAHPADKYTSASIFLVSRNKSGELCTLFGERLYENVYENLGGQSDPEDDENLSDTAAREALEESSELIPLPGESLKAFPYHDLLTHFSGHPFLHRMYMVPCDKELPLDQLQDFVKGSKSGRHRQEYTDFKEVPLKAIQAALSEGPQGFEKGQPVYRVKLEDGSVISLHPSLARMLEQEEVRRHLDCLVEGKPFRKHPKPGSIRLETPATIAQKISEQTLHKSDVLMEFKQVVAPVLQEASEEYSGQEPLPNEGTSGIHQAPPPWRSQTELYLQAMLGEQFDPDPEGLEANVRCFLDTVSVFKNDPDFRIESHRKQMVEMILKEREAVARGEIVLYHAAQGSINFIIEFFTQLRRYLFAEAREGYRAFRATDAFTQMFGHIDELLKHFSKGQSLDEWMEQLSKSGNIIDYDTFFQELVLSCNPFLFGNDGSPNSSSLSIFLQNSSVLPPKTEALLKKIMRLLGLGEPEIYAALQLFEAFQTTEPQGKLYQICLDKEMMDDTSYLAWTQGMPHPLEQETRISKVLEKLHTNPVRYKEYIEYLQARLFLNPEKISGMHVNEFQNTEGHQVEAHPPEHPLAQDIKQLARTFAQTILTKNRASEVFATPSGIIGQVQSVRKELGIPVEKITPLTRFSNAIRTRNIHLVLEMMQQYPDLDLSHLPVESNSQEETTDLLRLVGVQMPENMGATVQALLHSRQNLEIFILHAYNFEMLLKNMPEDCDDIITELLDALKNRPSGMKEFWVHFSNIFNLLETPQHQNNFLETAMHLFFETDCSSDNFASILSVLDSTQQKPFFRATKARLPDMISSLDSLQNIYRLLDKPGQAELLQLMKDKLPKMISRSSEEAIRNLLNLFTIPQLSESITSIYMLRDIFSAWRFALPAQLEALFQHMIPRFPKIIRNIYDFTYVCERLKVPEQAALIERMMPKFPEMIRSGYELNDVLRLLKIPEQTELVERMIPEFPRFMEGEFNVAATFRRLKAPPLQAHFIERMMLEHPERMLNRVAGSPSEAIPSAPARTLLNILRCIDEKAAEQPLEDEEEITFQIILRLVNPARFKKPLQDEGPGTFQRLIQVINPFRSKKETPKLPKQIRAMEMHCIDYCNELPRSKNIQALTDTLVQKLIILAEQARHKHSPGVTLFSDDPNARLFEKLYNTLTSDTLQEQPGPSAV